MTRAAPTWIVRGLTLLAVLLIVGTAWRSSVRVADAGTRLGPGAAVLRGTVRLASIERVTRGRGRGRLPIYLAPVRGPVVDSARVGALAARLTPGSELGHDPVITLVPRDSVRGLGLVGRLVVTLGEPGLLVFGGAAPR